MTTGYLLTCGTSLLARLVAPGRDPVGELLAGALADVDPMVLGAMSRDGFAYEPELRGVLADFAALRGLAMQLVEDERGREPAALGAELESLVRRMRGQGPEGSRPLRVDDPIALIVSDTPQGVTAGLLIAAMTGRAIRVLRHSGTPDETIHGWEEELAEAGPGADPAGAPIDVYVIPALATGSERAVSDAAPWLAGALARTVGGVLRNELWSVIERSEAEISGGFKATLPLVHALLEYCAPIARAPISCVLRHESAPDVWIRVGLRQLTRKELAMRLQEVREVRDGGIPEVQMMRGFAWRMSDSPTGSRTELTPEGWGILAFPPPS